MRIEPPEPIDTPLLKTFCYFQLTDQIVVKTVVCPQIDDDVDGNAKSNKQSVKGGHLAAAPVKGRDVTRPTAPTLKGQLEVLGAGADEEEEDDNDEGGDDGEEVGDASGDLHMEMAALEAATKKTSDKRKSAVDMAITTKKLKGVDKA